jgi:hypothetical protein
LKDQLEKEVLNKIRREDLEIFFMENFVEKPRKLEIHCSNENFESSNELQLKERLKEKKENIKVINENYGLWKELDKYEYRY